MARDTKARHTLPIPEVDPHYHVHFPRPSPVPVLPTEAELERAEKRLEQTEERDRSTRRPGLLNTRQDKQNVKRTIHKLETAIESGKLKERDMYDAIMNLHLLQQSLKKMEHPGMHTASSDPAEAFEHALRIRRIVSRYLRQTGR
jgi:hypothetical protein